jgi:hypothetical protein
VDFNPRVSARLHSSLRCGIGVEANRLTPSRALPRRAVVRGQEDTGKKIWGKKWVLGQLAIAVTDDDICALRYFVPVLGLRARPATINQQ